MKKFLKQHWLVILILIFALSCVFNSCYKFNKNQENIEKRQAQNIAICTANVIDEQYVEFCNNYMPEIEKEKGLKVDFYTMMSDILVWNLHFFNGIAFLILVIPTLLSVCKILKNKYILNASYRESYKGFLKEFFAIAYQYVWLLPLIAGVLILYCIFSTSLDPSYSIYFGTSIWNSEIIRHPILFVILYMLNILLYSCSFINLALIVVRKQQSYIKGVILSFLTYFGIEIFFEIVVNALVLQKMFNSNLGYTFNIMNIFMFSDTYGLPRLLIFTFAIFIVSIIGVYFAYRNKENLVIDCEKNN